ncbi:MAG: polysaccharide deacetylase family protein [Syntrophobacter sp.]
MMGASGSGARDYGLAASYMPRQCSPLWKTAPPDWRDQLDHAMALISHDSIPPLFFRADDIGAAGQAFEALCGLFRHHQVPLALAVVPAWLSDARQERLFAAAPMEEHLWGWHQHGWRHVNWQTSGKKSEFGGDRPLDRQHGDILQGRQKMEAVFGRHFIPVFTPPWNRFSTMTVKALRSLDFKGISATNPLPHGVKLPWGFCSLPVHLDLHTRKDKSPADGLNSLLTELCALSKSGETAGIMIHHQRMTPFAFQFLDHLLYNLKHVIRARFFSFREFLDGCNENQAGARIR